MAAVKRQRSEEANVASAAAVLAQAAGVGVRSGARAPAVFYVSEAVMESFHKVRVAAVSKVATEADSVPVPPRMGASHAVVRERYRPPARRRPAPKPKPRPDPIELPEGPTTGVDFSGSWKLDLTRETGVNNFLGACGVTETAREAAPKLVNNVQIKQSRTRFWIKRESAYGFNLKKFVYGVPMQIRSKGGDVFDAVVKSDSEKLTTTTTLSHGRGTITGVRTYVQGGVPDTMRLKCVLRRPGGRTTRMTRYFLRDGPRPPRPKVPSARALAAARAAQAVQAAAWARERHASPARPSSSRPSSLASRSSR